MPAPHTLAETGTETVDDPSPEREERQSLLARIFPPAASRSRVAAAIRRSFAFSHSASQRAQQQAVEDIETGQASTAASRSDDDCTGREGHLTSASSAPNALERQAVLASIGSPASPSQLETQPSTLSAGGISPRSSPHAPAGVLSKLLSVSSRGLKRSPSGNQPVCLICLENLTPEDFEAGEAIQLECECRGDLALRHNSCAVKWARVKGDNVCDICKQPIKNLPVITPRAPSEPGSEVDMTGFDDDVHNHPHGLHGPFMTDQMPSNSDIIFDCIRVTWVAMIICILFFEMNLASALWTGIITGLAYTLFVRAMYQSQLDVLHREQAMRQGRLQTAGAQPVADGASPVSPLNTQQQHPYVVVV
ncbi:hypothetical protein ABBQ38_000227 [Trebouxia sp. C0009 RCD-2024]